MDKKEKAIRIVELEKDLANLVAQANQISGAAQYVQSKIAELKNPDEDQTADIVK